MDFLLADDWQIQMTDIWIINLIVTRDLISTNINALAVIVIKFKGVSVCKIAGSIPETMSIPKDSF